MTDYNDYITAVNKIFDYLAKMKAGWNNTDNMSYIESIEEYKDKVISNAEKFKQATPVKKLDTLDGNVENTSENNEPKIYNLSEEKLPEEGSEEDPDRLLDDSLEAMEDD